MVSEEEIALPCPYCRQELYQPLSWFKQTYFTCPACGGGLAAGQFETVIGALEEALESTVEEMLRGEEKGGCCGQQSSGGPGGPCAGGC